MQTFLKRMHTLLQEMESEEDSPRPSNRRRVEDDSEDDEMLGNGQDRFGHGRGGQEEDEESEQRGPLPPYELHRVDPDPFDWNAEGRGLASDLDSARQLMDSLGQLFAAEHYHGEAYAGMLAKLFNLPLTESHPDFRDVVDIVFQQTLRSSPSAVANEISMLGWHADTVIASVRAVLLPNKAHPSVQPTYEQDMQLLDSMSSMIYMHRFTLLSVVAQQAGDLKIMADAAIEMKPFEDQKDQVKLQRHLFRLFEQQKNRVYADKVASSYSNNCWPAGISLFFSVTTSWVFACNQLARTSISLTLSCSIVKTVLLQVMRQIIVPVVASSGEQQQFKTRCWKVLYRDPMGSKFGSEVGTVELDVETWVNDNLDTDNPAVLEWSASSSEKHSAREALRINHKVSIAAAQRNFFSFASEDSALIYDIRADKTYPMGNGLPEHIMVGGFHNRPFDPYLENRDGGFWDGNWFEIPTALDKVSACAYLCCSCLPVAADRIF